MHIQIEIMREEVARIFKNINPKQKLWYFYVGNSQPKRKIRRKNEL